jgi:hypothetical protein
MEVTLSEKRNDPEPKRQSREEIDRDLREATQRLNQLRDSL